MRSSNEEIMIAICIGKIIALFLLVGIRWISAPLGRLQIVSGSELENINNAFFIKKNN